MTNSTDVNGQPEVGPDQVWADNDPRCKGLRTIRIDSISYQRGQRRASCTVLTDSDGNAPAKRKTVHINVARLKPTSNGYRYLRTEADADQ
jgi:hypothetical protein